jgi:3-deoxy-7-phosphoheptulonate synthase
VAAVKHLSHLPIIVDPSHGTGKWRMVKPMAFAAIAAGADGLMMEVHPNPAKALSDGPQSLTPENYYEVMAGVRKLAGFMSREGIEPMNLQ